MDIKKTCKQFFKGRKLPRNIERKFSLWQEGYECSSPRLEEAFLFFADISRDCEEMRLQEDERQWEVGSEDIEEETSFLPSICENCTDRFACYMQYGESNPCAEGNNVYPVARHIDCEVYNEAN